MSAEGQPLPEAEPRTGLAVLRGLARDRSLLTAMEIMRDLTGPAFRLTLPGFQPAVMVGPTSNRQIMVSKRDHFQWRSPSDPVTKLLRHGLLVEDGQEHARLRGAMEPVLLKPRALAHVPAMAAYTDRVAGRWAHGSVQDMLVEMRRLALMIFMGTLLDVEFEPDLDRLWRPILRAIKYISPGLWIIWPDLPRPGFRRPLAQLDEYLYGLIAERRQLLRREEAIVDEEGVAGDLLTQLAARPQMSDDLIRDQILTMLIAGHDTSTALLAWALHLLAAHPQIMDRARQEVDAVLGNEPPRAEQINALTYLDWVIKETMRLYPPIHVGNRIVAQDTTVDGYELKAGSRVMASIYLSHRDERHWQDPGAFCPHRFDRRQERPPAYSYVPFGAGPRACIGAAFAQIEAKVVLARLLQKFTLTDTGRAVKPYMGATLEPHPGVYLRVERRDHG